MDISDLCSESGIILYCLKSHASHLIQPLDQAVFGSMKSAWEAEAKKQVLRTGESVSIKSFASVLKPVWEATTTPENAFNGFSKSGIFPFNPERVLNSDKLLPNLSFQDMPCSTSASDEILILNEDSTVGASSTSSSSTNQTDANNLMPMFALLSLMMLCQQNMRTLRSCFNSLWLLGLKILNICGWIFWTKKSSHLILSWVNLSSFLMKSSSQHLKSHKCSSSNSSNKILKHPAPAQEQTKLSIKSCPFPNSQGLKPLRN